MNMMMFNWFKKTVQKETQKKEVQVEEPQKSNEPEEKDDDDVIVVYKDRVEIKGYSDPNELAMTICLINSGNYEISITAALAEHIAKIDIKNRTEFANKFVETYQTCLGETKPKKLEKPFIRPMEAFK